jgi:hypothetical protein
MKITLPAICSVGLGLFAVSGFLLHRQSTSQSARLAELQASWRAEKAKLEMALENAKSRPRTVNVPAAPAAAVGVFNGLSPAEIVAKLRALKTGSGASVRLARQTISVLKISLRRVRWHCRPFANSRRNEDMIGFRLRR